MFTLPESNMTRERIAYQWEGTLPTINFHGATVLLLTSWYGEKHISLQETLYIPGGFRTPDFLHQSTGAARKLREGFPHEPTKELRSSTSMAVAGYDVKNAYGGVQIWSGSFWLLHMHNQKPPV